MSESFPQLAGVEPTPREIITRGVRGATRCLAHAVAISALEERIPPLNPLETAELERLFSDLRALVNRLEGR